MDTNTTQIISIIGSAITIIGFIYAFLRNFKIDIKEKITGMEKRIDTLEERMFLLATGKTLSQAILEEKIKKENEKQGS